MTWLLAVSVGAFFLWLILLVTYGVAMLNLVLEAFE